MHQLQEFVTNHWPLFAALVAILAMLIGNVFGDIAAAAKFVSPAEAVRLINREDPVVVDLRDAAGFDSGHIGDALNVPMAKLAERMPELARHRDKNVLLCCASGTLCGRASDQLRKAGFSRLFALRGGIAAWQQENLPLVRR